MHKILILDFGSQTTQLIGRRIRESGVYCEIHPCTMSDDAIMAFAPCGIVLSGGPASTTLSDCPTAPDIVFKIGCPILGICYGMQTMVTQLGGTAVISHGGREFGLARIDITEDCDLFGDVWLQRMRKPRTVWMSHGDKIQDLPPGFVMVANSTGVAAIADEKRQFYGLLFHPEVSHTPDGSALLRNFTHNICDCDGNWTMTAFAVDAVSRIREQVGTGKVICGLSGGVDSAVTAILVHAAIGDQLTCVFVDNGLLRKNEAHEVVSLFREKVGITLVHVPGEDVFLRRLKGVTDPEKKRKIIGKTFIDLFQDVADASGAEFLAQGTLYPDVIESFSPRGGPSATIKTHHNVGGLPENMKLKLVEPLRDLFKDEVRMLGLELSLPYEFVGRHPFPGPGLAIRILGKVTRKRLAILREADAIFLEEIRNCGLYDDIWQAFAVLLPVNSVGVMGDARTYQSVCVLRAVESTDGMTATAYRFSDDFIDNVASRIINEVVGINRVTYDRTSKPPGTIEWE